MILIISGEFVTKRLSSVSSTEANLEGHKLKDGCEVERVVTQWLITWDTGLCQQGVGKLVPRYDKYLHCGGHCVEQ
jgi:hypothetical protein